MFRQRKLDGHPTYLLLSPLFHLSHPPTLVVTGAPGSIDVFVLVSVGHGSYHDPCVVLETLPDTLCTRPTTDPRRVKVTTLDGVPYNPTSVLVKGFRRRLSRHRDGGSMGPTKLDSFIRLVPTTYERRNLLCEPFILGHDNRVLPGSNRFISVNY